MATHIPDKLKTADLTRFIVRAAQLEKVKPVMAYWCA
jgi:vacuolar protein sorting-associated protein VTA1